MNKLVYIERVLERLETRLDSVHNTVEKLESQNKLHCNSIETLTKMREGCDKACTSQIEFYCDKLTQLYTESQRLVNTKLQVLLKETSKNTEKLDSLFFENEVFKHQLSLEDDIRRYIQEIDDLTDIITENVRIIDSLTN